MSAADHDGRLILVEGEAGIGKTRLAEVAADDVRAHGGIVLATRGYPGEEAIAYGPIADLLRTGLATAGGVERLASLDPTTLGEVGRLVDLPAALRGSARPAPIGGEYARVRLLDAVADALTALAGGATPGLVWIDDFHLVDESTRQAAMYLARRLRGRPIALLLAWRREDMTDDGLATADDLARVPGVLVLALERLDRAAVETLVRASEPSTGGNKDALIDSVVAGSEGLPLHIVEMLASDEPGSGGVSRGVRELLRERIASVGEIAAQVLSAAAVIGRSFDLTTLRQTSGRSEEETVDALEELVRRGIVREIEVGPDGLRYDFSHGRLRDAAYETTSLARRRLLHRRTADALRLDAADADRDPISHFARIAGHERAAGRPIEAAVAFLDAAERAEAVFANREAIDQLEAALALGRPDAARIHARIGELRARLGDTRRRSRRSRPPQPSRRPRSCRPSRCRWAASIDGAATCLQPRATWTRRWPPETCRRSCSSAPSSSAAVSRSRRASWTSRPRRRSKRGRSRPRRAIRTAGVSPSGWLGLVAQARGDLATARHAFERSRTLAADDPDPTAAIAASTALAIVLAADGKVDDAVEAASAAIEDCRRIGDRHLEAAVENHVADLLHQAGQEADAMDHLKRAVALFAEIGDAAPEPDPGIWALAAW